MTEQTQMWDDEQLRRAIWLALPPTTAGNPSLEAAATATGVSVRSVQRWLSGTCTPSAEHATALRTALLPPPQILVRQHEQRVWAIEANKVIGAPRGRGVDPSWRSQGWHKPHVLRILHHAELGISRIAVGLAAPAKRYYPPHGWVTESETTYPHWPAALLAKHAHLDQVAGHRVRIRPALLGKGRHECWMVSLGAASSEDRT